MPSDTLAILGFLISNGPCTLRALPLRPRAALAPMLDLIERGYVRSAEGADAALVFCATPAGERAEVRWRNQ